MSRSSEADKDRELARTLFSRNGSDDFATLPASAEEILLRSDRYDDRGILGRGGMGTVRRVYDQTLMREVAVKVLHPDLEGAGRRVTRFTEEAQITGQLEHPFVVPIHDLNRDGEGNHFFSMKLVQGETLKEKIRAAGAARLQPDRLAELLEIFLRVCDALAFAHSRGVIHRDVKPSNVMVGEFGQVYLMDWGVARLAHKPQQVHWRDDQVKVAREPTESSMDVPGTVVGTPRYMSPEQVEGNHELVDERSDIFSLGATLYQILVAHPPYRAKKLLQLLYEVQCCEIRPPEDATLDGRIPPELSRIAMKAMAPDPDARYASVLEMKRDIEKFLRGSWHQPVQEFPAGSLIVKEGEEGDAAYIIVEGRCVAFDDSGPERVVLRVMGPGEVFGETAIFAAGPRTASVEAMDRVRAVVVTRETLSTGLGLNTWMGDFVKALAERFSEVDQKLRRLEREKLESSKI